MSTQNAWNNKIAAGTAITLNAGTNQVDISSDAAATTVNLATGGGVKTVQLGSTNTTSPTVIKSGTGNIAMNSGLTVDSTGRNYNTAQPAFSAYLNTTKSDVTGDTTGYVIPFDTEVFDQGSNFNTANGTFTAPILGRYMLSTSVRSRSYTTSYTLVFVAILTSNRNYFTNMFGAGKVFETGAASDIVLNGCALVDMDAGDTATVLIEADGSTKTIDVIASAGSSNQTAFMGYLAF